MARRIDLEGRFCWLWNWLMAVKIMRFEWREHRPPEQPMTWLLEARYSWFWQKLEPGWRRNRYCPSEAQGEHNDGTGGASDARY